MKKLIIVLCLMIVSVMGCQTKENKEVAEEKTKTEASKDTEVITEKEIAINTSGEETAESKQQEQKAEGKQVSSEHQKENSQKEESDSTKQPVTNPSTSQKESENMELISEEEAEKLVKNYVVESGRSIKDFERIYYDHTEGYNLIVHYYEQHPDHTATINWYEVDGVTGAVVPQF